MGPAGRGSLLPFACASITLFSSAAIECAAIGPMMVKGNFFKNSLIHP
jgi:hypothetical protein